MVYYLSMKKLLIATLFVFLLLPHSAQAATAKKTTIKLPKDLTGRIVLQTESYDRAWYISPVNKKRYYLKNGQVLKDFLATVGLGITNSDLKKIPRTKTERGNAKLVTRLKGRVLLQVENAGEAWYVNPADGLRYPLQDWESVRRVIDQFGLPVKNTTLSQFTMNTVQLVPDTLFNDVAHVKYQDGKFSGDYHADDVLPLASLTKLMTALVLLDLNPTWDRAITITPEIIRYPKVYVGNDATSEVDLRVGDSLTVHDTWIAMLMASSNQSAAALVDTSGLSRTEFVALMNKKAHDLGLHKTIFYDVAGLDEDNVSTPKEMALLAAEAFSHSMIAQSSVMTSFNIAATDAAESPRTISVVNRNYSLLAFGVDGAKTGYLVEAQRNAAVKKGDTIAIVMHAASLPQRNKIIGKLLAQ